MAMDIEQKTVFAVATDKDGVPIVMVGIPAGAWACIKDGKTSTFDFTKVGMPFKLMLFGASDHAQAMATLQQGAAMVDLPILDERRRDFSIEDKNDITRVRHRKRGTEYDVMGPAKLQTSRPLVDMESMVVYRGDDGQLWVRATDEFEDGRFEPLEVKPK